MTASTAAIILPVMIYCTKIILRALKPWSEWLGFLWSRILCKTPTILTSLWSDMAPAKIGRPVAINDDLKWACGTEKFPSTTDRTYEGWGNYIRANSKCFRGQTKQISKVRYANTCCPPIGIGPPSFHEQPTILRAAKMAARLRAARSSS